MLGDRMLIARTHLPLFDSRGWPLCAGRVAAALGGGEPRLQRLPALRLAFDCATLSPADDENGRLAICPTIGWFLYSAGRLFRLAEDQARIFCFLLDDGLALTRVYLPLVAVRYCLARVTVGEL
jgi:hypothetical protein